MREERRGRSSMAISEVRDLTNERPQDQSRCCTVLATFLKLRFRYHRMFYSTDATASLET